MNTAIADILRSKIKDLPFVDRIAGMVRPLIKIDTDDSGVVSRKVFPIACKVSQQDCNETGKETDLCPNTDYKTLIYFEDLGVSFIERRGDLFTFRSRLRLVCWINLAKFDTDECSISATLAATIIGLLPQEFFNDGEYQRIQVKDISMPPKNSQIFSQYTYLEETNQYLLYPFDYFALDIDTMFSLRKSCMDDIANKISEC